MISDEQIKEQLNHTFDKTDFPTLGKKYAGKVRDNYTKEDQRIIIVTDKVSAFDRILTTIPFKGQILNQMAKFWFEKTKDIVPNHMIATPDPNVMVVKECKPLPVEMVIRAYMTGSTKTSILYNYMQGVRNFCGNQLPDGLKKDQKLPGIISTPSTKAELGGHDESVSKEELIKRGVVDKETIDKIEDISFKLFNRGKEIIEKQGLIFVDTKYEFGIHDGNIMLMDEIHTPDSSRFWFANTYEELFQKGEEQRKIDKEYIRTWLKNERNFVGDGDVPEIPDDVRITAAKKYMEAFELITGQTFTADIGNPVERIKENLQKGGFL